MPQIVLKINKSLKNYRSGNIITLLTDDNYVPVDFYWAKRISDAKIDNCVEIIDRIDEKKQEILSKNEIHVKSKKSDDKKS